MKWRDNGKIFNFVIECHRRLDSEDYHKEINNCRATVKKADTLRESWENRKGRKTTGTRKNITKRGLGKFPFLNIEFDIFVGDFHRLWQVAPFDLNASLPKMIGKKILAIRE